MRKSLAILLLGLTATSCASIISTNKQGVRITSYPAGAVILDNGTNIGRTPITAQLSRKNDHMIQLKLDGYQTFEISLTKKFNEVALGNILLGGLIGLGVDAISGAIYKLSPSEVLYDFEDAASSSAILKDGNTTIFVVLKENPQGELIGQLQKENPDK